MVTKDMEGPGPTLLNVPSSEQIRTALPTAPKADLWKYRPDRVSDMLLAQAPAALKAPFKQLGRVG